MLNRVFLLIILLSICISDLAFSADNNLLTFAQDATSTILKISEQNVNQIIELRELKYADSVVRDIAFQPSSNRLALIKLKPQSGLDGDVVFLDKATFKEIILPHAFTPATTLTFSPDGSIFVVGSEQGSIIGYNTATFEQLWDFQSSNDIVNDLAVSSDNNYLGATFTNPEIGRKDSSLFQLLQLPSGDVVTTYPLQTDVYGGGVTFDESHHIVLFSTINMATSRISIHTLNIQNDASEQTIDEEDGLRGYDLLFDPKQTALFYIGSDGIQMGQVTPKSITQNRILGSVQKGESIVKIALHPNEPILAVGLFKRKNRPDGGPSATNEGIIRLYNTSTGEEMVSLDVLDGSITSLAFSPDGTLVASGGTDGTVRLWGIPTG